MTVSSRRDPVEWAEPQATTSSERVVLDLIRTTFQGGRVREGVERCIAVEYTQHNPAVADGREPVIKFFEELWARFPASFTYQVRHLVSSGDLVCVHAYSSAGEAGEVQQVAIFDLFRGRRRADRRALGRYPAVPGDLGQRPPHVLKVSV